MRWRSKRMYGCAQPPVRGNDYYEDEEEQLIALRSRQLPASTDEGLSGTRNR
jgi:hypothetical protein